MKLLIAYLIFTFGLIGFISVANAEEIDIPFEPSSSKCTDNSGTFELEFTCTFRGQTPFGIRVIQDGLDELDRAVLEGIDYLRGNGQYVTPPEDDSWKYTPVDDTTEFEDERAIQKAICSKRSLDNADKELCRLLEQLELCNQGYGRLKTVQEVRSFVVTLVTPDDLKQWDLKRNFYLGDALSKYEECRATTTFHDEVLSQMYADFIVDDISNNYLYHGDFATTDEVYPSHRLTQYSYDRSITNAYQSLCYSDNGFTDSFKRQQGCVLEPYEGTFKNETGVPLKGEQAEIMAKYWDCRNNDNCVIDKAGKYVIINKIEGDFAIKVEDKD